MNSVSVVGISEVYILPKDHNSSGIPPELQTAVSKRVNMDSISS